MACWELGCQPGIAALGVTTKSVEATTHNGEPSQKPYAFPDCGVPLTSHPKRLASQHIVVVAYWMGGEPGGAALAAALSQPKRLRPQHIALYRSVAGKRTIKQRDSTPRHQETVWRVVITIGLSTPITTSRPQQTCTHSARTVARPNVSPHRHAQLPPQQRRQRIQCPCADGIAPEQQSSGEPVMNSYQTVLTASITVFFVRRKEGQ